MGLPKEKFYVQMRRGTETNWRFATAGAKGGTVNSLEAALDRKMAILRAYPGSVVNVYRSKTEWELVE